jgi:hypothetical protein
MEPSVVPLPSNGEEVTGSDEEEDALLQDECNDFETICPICLEALSDAVNLTHCLRESYRFSKILG